MSSHRTRQRPFGLILALTAAGLSTAALVANRDRISFSPDATDDKTPEPFACITGSHKGFYANGDRIAVVSSGGWQVFDSTGACLAADDTPVQEPTCIMSGALSVFYSPGDSAMELQWSDGNQETWKLEAPISFVDVNDSAQLAVITHKDGYNGSVTAYSKAKKPLFRWDCSSVWPVSARMSPKGRLAVGCVSEDGYRVTVFSTETETPLLDVRIPCESFVDMAFMDENTLAILSDTALRLETIDQSAQTVLSLDGRYPAYFECSEELAVLVSSAERFGGSQQITVVSSNGRILAQQSAKTKILSLGIREDRILLLSPGELTLYSRFMEPIRSHAVEADAQQAFLFPGNLALVAGAQGITPYDLG